MNAARSHSRDNNYRLASEVDASKEEPNCGPEDLEVGPSGQVTDVGWAQVSSLAASAASAAMLASSRSAAHLLAARVASAQ